MYISIKLPPAFGSFNRLRQENYPFNSLFTAYLAEVSRLGLSLGLDIEELVGYIEDRLFEGERLPDIPEGDEPVNMRYKTDDEDVVAYIGGSKLTNRMAVLYITRMTLRLSAAHGNSLFRLTKLISDLNTADAAPARMPKEKPAAKPKETAPVKKNPVPIKKEEKHEEKQEETPVPMPRVSSKAAVSEPVTAKQPAGEQKSSVLESAEAAKAALSELTELTAAAQPADTAEGEVIETNPLLGAFGGI